MSEIKYTTDGKKVVVIGNLNSQEKIVQEIFVVNDVEIPSGENFVVKSLHDAPVISWKDAEIKKLKERNERLLSNLESEGQQYFDQLEKKRDEFRKQSKILSDKMKFIAGAVKNANEQTFNDLIGFVEGKFKFIVKDAYSPEIISFNQTVDCYEKSESWSGIKLLTLFGCDDGNMRFKCGQYSDGSGSNYIIYPFETYEEALEKLDWVINSREITATTFEVAKKYNITLNQDGLKQYKEKQGEDYKKALDDRKKQVNQYEKLIEELEKS